MHVSGILVLAEPERIDCCRRELESLPGVSVYHTHRASGRMIAVLESAGVDGQEAGLRRIQGLPSVRLAALVEHRIDDGDDPASGPGTDPESLGNRPATPATEVS